MASKSTFRIASVCLIVLLSFALWGCNSDPIKSSDKPLLTEQAQKKAAKRAEEQNN